VTTAARPVRGWPGCNRCAARVWPLVWRGTTPGRLEADRPPARVRRMGPVVPAWPTAPGGRSWSGGARWSQASGPHRCGPTGHRLHRPRSYEPSVRKAVLALALGVSHGCSTGRWEAARRGAEGTSHPRCATPPSGDVKVWSREPSSRGIMVFGSAWAKTTWAAR
jgi:hypothetical protein